MTANPTRIIVNLDLPAHSISRHIYGHFAEHLGRCIYGGFWVGPESDIPNVHGIRSDVVDALKAIQIPNLRWPGGCFADEYHWRDGIGPREQRPRMVNSHWGDVVEDNSFGTHEFMELCELLGADPYVNGNVGSGTVREMSEWVEYLTRADESPMASLRRANGRDEPWKVPFWGVGNEGWGCGGNMRPEAFRDLARQYSTFVRNHGDNVVYRIAAGANIDDYAWTDTLLEGLDCTQCGPDSTLPYQAVSLHYYTMTGPWEDKGNATSFSKDQYYLALSRAGRMEELLTRHSTVMDRRDPQKTIGLVVDEWGTWWNVEEGTNPGFLYQQNSMRDALVASLHFDSFHRHADRVVMANIAQTVNVLQAMILTDPDTNALVLTPTYHVFEMNTGHHDADYLHTYVKDSPTLTIGAKELSLVSASASTRDNSALISVSNLDTDNEQRIVLDLRGRDVESYSGRVLTASTASSFNDPQRPDEVAPRELEGIRRTDHGLEVVLPPHSYATVSLNLR